MNFPKFFWSIFNSVYLLSSDFKVIIIHHRFTCDFRTGDLVTSRFFVVVVVGVGVSSPLGGADTDNDFLTGTVLDVDS